MSTTINTYHSSFNPPPVPPRSADHRGGPVLPSNTPLVKFISVLLLLLMIQTFGGFLYLFHKISTVSGAAEGQVAFSKKTGSYTIPQAKLVLNENMGQSNTLLWSTSLSVLDKVSLSMSGVLTIQYPGYYLIQSQVTFSKAHAKDSLNQVLLTQTRGKPPSELLRSFCSLPRGNVIPSLCTASETAVFRLEKDQTLFVNVTDKDLVNPDFTTFGLFRLQD